MTNFQATRIAKLASAYEQNGVGYFSGPDIDALQSMLHLDDRETASMVAQAITEVLFRCENYIWSRARIPADSYVKDRLAAIAQHCEDLSRLLEKEKNNYPLFHRAKREKGKPRMTLAQIREINQRPKQILEDLRLIAAQARQPSRR